MKSLSKTVAGIAVLMVSIYGLWKLGSIPLGSAASIVFAILGVGVPLYGGIINARRNGDESPFADAALNCWPFCVVTAWTLISGFKQWGYSYTLAAREQDVIGFILYLAAIATWAFLGARSYAKSEQDNPQGKLEIQPGTFTWAVIITVLFTSVVGLFLALARHNSFHSKAWDLAIFTQLAYNITHGNGIEVSIRGLPNILADHFQPIMFPVAYISNLLGGATGLIILQVIAGASGVIPLALIGLKRNPGNMLLAIVPAVMYSLYVPLIFLLINDFHPITLIVPILLWAFYFLETKRTWAFTFFLILAGCCQEEAWIIIGMVGLYLALFRGMKIFGIITLIIAWVIFFFVVLVFIPSVRPEGDYFYIHRYAYLGNSAGEIGKNILLHPWLWIRKIFDSRSIAFVLMMLCPLGFLPMRRPKLLLIIIPAAFYTLISGYDIQRTIFHQYTAPFIPFLLLATIDGLDRVTSRGGKFLAMGGIWCAVSSIVMMLILPIGGFGNIYSADAPSDFDSKLDRHILGLINPEDRVSSISKYAPHLASRQFLTLFPTIEWDGEWADKIIVDGKELITEADRQALAQLLYKYNEGPDYDLYYYYNGIFLFEQASGLQRWGKTISAVTPSTDDLPKATSGGTSPAGKVTNAGLMPYTPGSQDIADALGVSSDGAFWLKSVSVVTNDLDSSWFIVARCEDESGNPVFTYPHFPLYGPYYDVTPADGEHPTAYIFNRGPRMIMEAYAVDASHLPRQPLTPAFGRSDVGPPVRIRFLFMKLPEGWTNTLDEYVADTEATSGLPWDEGFVFELNGE